MGLFVLTSCDVSIIYFADGIGTYVKSQGRLNTLSHSLHRCAVSLTVGWADLRLRAIDRMTSSSDPSLEALLSP